MERTLKHIQQHSQQLSSYNLPMLISTETSFRKTPEFPTHPSCKSVLTLFQIKIRMVNIICLFPVFFFFFCFISSIALDFARGYVFCFNSYKLVCKALWKKNILLKSVKGKSKPLVMLTLWLPC